jgi:hypothetical protein
VAMVERVRHGGGAPEVEDSGGRMGQRRAADAVGAAWQRQTKKEMAREEKWEEGKGKRKSRLLKPT